MGRAKKVYNSIWGLGLFDLGFGLQPSGPIVLADRIAIRHLRGPRLPFST